MMEMSKIEKMILKKIFHTRIKIFSVGYSIFSFWLLRFLFGQYFLIDDYNKVYKKGGDYEFFGHQMTRLDMFYLLAVFFGVLFFIPGFIVFKNRIYPFYLDIKNGKKEPVHLKISRKQEFIHVNKYYFFFNDLKVKHFEVEEHIYNDYCVGDELIIYRAPKSKYVFVKEVRFEIL